MNGWKKSECGTYFFGDKSKAKQKTDNLNFLVLKFPAALKIICFHKKGQAKHKSCDRNETYRYKLRNTSVCKSNTYMINDAHKCMLPTFQSGNPQS